MCKSNQPPLFPLDEFESDPQSPSSVSDLPTQTEDLESSESDRVQLVLPGFEYLFEPESSLELT